MKRRFQENNWRSNPGFKSLVKALCSCTTEEQMANFLRDIATLSELKAWSERLDVAKRLSVGQPYRTIAEDTGASTTTVSRVAWFLENGESGYASVIDPRRAVSSAHHHTLHSVPRVRSKQRQ